MTWRMELYQHLRTQAEIDLTFTKHEIKKVSAMMGQTRNGFAVREYLNARYEILTDRADTLTDLIDHYDRMIGS